MVDDQGNIVVEAGVYSYLKEAGDFVVAYREKLAAVLTLDGKTVILNPYGVVDEVYFPGSLVVYTSADVCLMIYKDGRSALINGAPTVKLRE
jgi:hypothetical protein